MIPFADIHCHLLAGLDDGPRTEADALAMCRLAYAEGTRMAAACAHQNERYSNVNPHGIRLSTERLSALLHRSSMSLMIFPSAEVTAHTDLVDSWRRGEVLSVADRGQYILLEMPQGLFVDLRETVAELRAEGVRVILAHPERHPELLHEDGTIEQLISVGCLVQVSSNSVTEPRSRQDARALKDWFRRGIVHLMGSDGHSPTRRPPRMLAAYRQVARWAGSTVADRVFSTNGFAVLQGLPLRVPMPQPNKVGWLPRLW